MSWTWPHLFLSGKGVKIVFESIVSSREMDTTPSLEQDCLSRRGEWTFHEHSLASSPYLAQQQSTPPIPPSSQTASSLGKSQLIWMPLIFLPAAGVHPFLPFTLVPLFCFKPLILHQAGAFFSFSIDKVGYQNTYLKKQNTQKKRTITVNSWSHLIDKALDKDKNDQWCVKASGHM